MILTVRSLPIAELLAQLMLTLRRLRPSLCHAAYPTGLSGLCRVMLVPWLSDKLTQLLVTEQAVRLLPLGTSDYATCMVLPLSKSVSRSSPVNMLPVYQ